MIGFHTATTLTAQTANITSLGLFIVTVADGPLRQMASLIVEARR